MSDPRLDGVAAKLQMHQQRHDAGQDDRKRLETPELPWKFLSPLMWAPIFPAVRLSTRSMPQGQRNVLIGVAILAANLHGFWLINNPDLSDEALDIKR